MKYGKAYEQLLKSPSFPQEWRDKAIEYKALKKLIHNVVDELAAMGLGPDVVKRLLAEGEAGGDASADYEGAEEGGLQLEIEEVGEPDGRGRYRVWLGGEGEEGARGHRRRRSSGGAGPLAEYVLDGPFNNPTPRLRLHLDHLPSSSTASSSHSHSTPSSRSPSSPHSTSSALPTTSVPSDAEAESDDPDGAPSPAPAGARKNRSALWTLQRGGEGLGSLDVEEEAEAVGEQREGEPPNGLEVPQVAVLPATPTEALKAEQHEAPPELALEPDAEPAMEEVVSAGVAAAAAADADAPQPTREVLIELESDAKFFSVLTAAFDTLESLQALQKQQFAERVESLCAQITQVAHPTPSSHGGPLAARLVSPGGSGKQRMSDLYAWREIFTLWIESQIYESATERARGERSVDAAETRLAAFAAEVVKRGLGDRRTLKNPMSRKALEAFLELNVVLLDLKKFQTANVEAARKILKKHDKRTALTASAGFPQFVRRLEGATAGSAGVGSGVKSWTFYTTSLPHVLLARLTETLLPVIPSIDDYQCMICQEIAFKPIRINCKHVFCVRCLVKMQKRGQNECPLCRAPVVLQADRSNVDHAMISFLELWFPREVKAKAKANDEEASREALEEMGINDTSGCSVM